LARAYALQSRVETGASEPSRNKAIAAYKQVLDLWKDADPDIPVLRQAKTECERLNP